MGAAWERHGMCELDLKGRKNVGVKEASAALGCLMCKGRKKATLSSVSDCPHICLYIAS
jgi:hypothetical protein